MKVLWPWALFTLALIPLIVALYIWMLRRKRRYAVRFSSIALIRAAMPRHARWRRHLPFALFVTGLAGLLVAMARPAARDFLTLKITGDDIVHCHFIKPEAMRLHDEMGGIAGHAQGHVSARKVAEALRLQRNAGVDQSLLGSTIFEY